MKVQAYAGPESLCLLSAATTAHLDQCSDLLAQHLGVERFSAAALLAGRTRLEIGLHWMSA